VRKLFLLYLFALIALSTLPLNKGDSAINHIFIVYLRLDYLLHALIYIPFLFLAGKTFRIHTLLLLLAGILLAFALEAIQCLLPYRAFNINDMLANGIGVVLGLLLLLPQADRLLRKLLHSLN
jgi:VanZ family protein